MRQFILQQNIARFRNGLAEAPDEARRRQIQRLLTEAEGELALYEATQTGVGSHALLGANPTKVAESRGRMIDWFRREFAEGGRSAALIDPDPGLVFVEVTPPYEHLTGLTRDQLVGQQLFQLFPDNPDDPAANGVSVFYASLRTVARTGQPDALQVLRYDVRGDNGRFAERYWHTTSSPLRDDEGRLIFLLLVVEEVTGEVLGASRRRAPG